MIISGTKFNGMYVMDEYYCASTITNIAIFLYLTWQDCGTWDWPIWARKVYIYFANKIFLARCLVPPLICETYVVDKQDMLSFHKGTHLAKTCLEYLHTNLCGLANIQTHGGNRYFLSIVDNFSRKVWIFMLETKYQTFNIFKN